MQDILDFLGSVHPFSRLPRATLGEVARTAEVRHVLERDPVLDDGAAPSLSVVWRGSLELRCGPALLDTLLPGDPVFLELAFATARIPAYTILALEDASLIRLSAEGLAKVLADEEAHALLDRRAAALRERLEEVQTLLRQSGADPFLRLAVRNVDCRRPLFVAKDQTVAQAARAMLAENATACLVREGERLLCILTERDIVKKVVAGSRDPETVPVEAIMTAPVVSVTPDTLLFEAFARMLKPAIRRLLVADEHGAPLGLLEERDILSARGENPVRLAADAAAAEGVESLRSVFEKLRAVAVRSVAEGIPSANVGRLISEIGGRIMQRVSELVLGGLGKDPPAPFSVAVMGSEGRREQFLGTDQDNALIFGRGEGREEETAAFFAAYAKRFVETLLAVGFPPCPSQIMMDNDKWRMGIAGWMNLVDEVVARAGEESILRVSLLVDLRHVVGDASLCAKLKEYLFKRVNANPVLIKYLAREAVRFSPPIGFFNNLVLEKSGEHKGELDMKKGAIFPLTLGIKTLALEHGIMETSTEERTLALERRGLLAENLSASLREAYDLFQTLRVRRQAEQIGEGARADNFIRPDRLSSQETDRLKDAFKVVVEFQSLLFNKYRLRLMT